MKKKLTILSTKQITIGNKWRPRIDRKTKLIITPPKISKELRDVIHGYIMSDGYVSPEGSLTVDQCLKQGKFTEWLFNLLTPLLTKDQKISTCSRINKKTNILTYSKRFNTRNLLKGFHHMWYEIYIDEQGKTCYRKKLPKTLDAFFNPTFISIWFAGDGTKMLDQRGAKFEVTSLNPTQRERLKKLFKTKFDINPTINRAGVSITGTTQWSLSILAEDYEKFRTIITKTELIPSLFPHKLCSHA